MLCSDMYGTSPAKPSHTHTHTQCTGKAGADAQQGEGAEAQPEDPSLQGATQEPSLAEEAHRGEPFAFIAFKCPG